MQGAVGPGSPAVRCCCAGPCGAARRGSCAVRSLCGGVAAVKQRRKGWSCALGATWL